MAEVIYRGEWPEDIQTTVEFVLTPLLGLVPGWCRILYVRFESSTEDHAAEISVHLEGRFATIRVTPDWLEELPDDRLRALIHEIVHIHVQPMRTVFHDLALKMVDDQGAKDFAWERFKEAWEGSTEDLAWAFHSILKP